MTLEMFPVVNATLNGSSAVLLGLGFYFIQRRRVTAHRNMMVSAFCTSAAFLACYLTFHTLKVMRGVTLTRFPPGPYRPFYLMLLGSHTVLAIVVLPMILLTLWRAYHHQWAQHRKIARVTFPIWFYVSVTGVVVYWALYHLAPRLAAQ